MFTASFLQVLGLLQVLLHAAVSWSLLNFSAPRGLFRAWSPQSDSRCRSKNGSAEALVKLCEISCAGMCAKSKTEDAVASSCVFLLLLLLQLGTSLVRKQNVALDLSHNRFPVACPLYMHDQWFSRKEMILLPLLRTVVVDDFCEDLCLSPLLDKHVVAQGGSPAGC